MKIVILDAETINPGDLHWDELSALGDLTVYPRCSDAEAVERMDNAEVVFFSKVNMTKELMDTNPNLKFLGITAT
ncbi:MAG: D-2-hydroxyacid dehydrogenase, partial [Anaerovoracaceae bacterium]